MKYDCEGTKILAASVGNLGAALERVSRELDYERSVIERVMTKLGKTFGFKYDGEPPDAFVERINFAMQAKLMREMEEQEQR